MTVDIATKPTVFFLTGEWDAFKRFVRGEVPEPEGMPSVYRPWLRYHDRGYDVHIFMIGNYGKSRVLKWKGCHIHLVARPRFFAWRNQQSHLTMRFPADQIIVYRAAEKVARLAKPTVVYSFQPWMSYAAWLLSRRFKATSVKRIYGTTLYEQWFARDGEIIGEEGSQCPRSKGRLMNRLACLPHFAAWLCPSDMMIISNDGTPGDKIADMLRINKAKYRFWLNGISKDWADIPVDPAQERKRLGIPSDAFVLMCLSRLSEWKRQDRVVDALPEILRAVPGAMLVLAGDGPKRQDLERRVADLAVSDHVLFTGAVPHSRVKHTLSTADVFLQVNDWSCLGNSLLEAIVCGRCIVTWDVGGTREVVEDDVNGVLLPRAEPERIAAAVIELSRRPERRRRLMQGATEFAARHLLSWNERLDKEIDLIESVGSTKKS